jgi:hypothetical protein
MDTWLLASGFSTILLSLKLRSGQADLNYRLSEPYLALKKAENAFLFSRKIINILLHYLKWHQHN